MGNARSLHEGDLHSSVHSSHDAETLHQSDLNGPLHDEWVEPKNLDAPPARPGMVQRWVRYHDRDGDDVVNMQYMMRKGWKPRPIETIPQEFRDYPVIKHANMDVIAVAGCILCEMPEAQALRIRAAVRQRTRNMDLAVNDETDRASRIGVARGHARIVRNEKISTSRRAPHIQGN